MKKNTPTILLRKLALALLTLGFVASASADSDLKVSPNKRYLVKASDGSPFFWIGDTAWGLSNKINHADIEQYLDNRQAKGFTIIQMTAHFFWSPESTGYGSVENNPRNTIGHRMFNGTASDPNTNSPKVVSGGGPDNPNDFWDSIDFIVRETKERGMHLVLLPTWGSKFINVDAGPDLNSPITPQFTATEAKTYGEWIGARYQNEPHIIWCMGGDTSPSAGDYGNKHAVYRAMAEGVVKGVTGTTVAWNQSHAAWDKVLMTYHAPSGTSSSNWFHNDVWLDFNMTQSGQRHPDEGADKVIEDYAEDEPVKPTLNAEATYEGYTFWDTSNPPDENTPLDVRRTLYQSMFAGGFGYTYGTSATSMTSDDDIWAFGNGSNGSAWKSRLNLEGAHDMTVAKNLLTARDWHTFVPSQAVITSGASSGATWKRATKSTAENEILVYFASNSSAGIKNTLTTSANAQWFDARNGNTQGAGTFTANQTRTMQPPSGWQDSVLIITGTGAGGGQTPYSGTPISIPGTIQAENFDNGGEDVAYNDTTTGNSGGASYRPGENVDISSNSDSGSGYHVGYPATGEWLEYTVNITSSGTYNLNIRASSLNGGGQMRVEVDGANVSGTVNVPQTGSWSTWQTTTVNGISLTAGQRIVRIYYIAPGCNLNWISFVSSGGGGAQIIVDNTNSGSVTITGSWLTSTSTPGYNGSNYHHDDNAGKGSKSFRFRPNLPAAGNYEVFLKWTSHANRASNVPVDVVYNGGTDGVQVDQQTSGGTWVSLGTYSFAAGTAGSVLISNAGTNGYVVADAVRFVQQ